MVKIQIDLTKEEDKMVEIYKPTKNFKTKQDAIKSMIRFLNVEIKPKNVNQKDYFEVG